MPEMRVRQADKLQQREMPEMRSVFTGRANLDQWEILHLMFNEHGIPNALRFICGLKIKVFDAFEDNLKMVLE